MRTSSPDRTSLPEWIPPTRSELAPQSKVRVATIIAALSHALDLSTGQPVGHSIRGCLLGMRIALEIALPDKNRQDLFYALMLKDAGCSGNASQTFHGLGDSDDLKAKRDLKTVDWTRVGWESFRYVYAHAAPGKPFLERAKVLFRLALHQKQTGREATKVRCERGSLLARLMGLPPATAEAIASLDEHWDGSGLPDHLRGQAIPLNSRIMLLAQTLDVFERESGADAAMGVIRARSKAWFDPDLVRAAEGLHNRGELFWQADGQQSENDLLDMVLELEPAPCYVGQGKSTLDAICVSFGQIVDAKSPFTFNHSNGVAHAAVAIGRVLGLSKERIVFLRHAALLHDLGKLGVSNAVLEKTGKLDPAEWEAVRLHPFYTWQILRGIPGFHEMSEVAASHHEKLDGSGYFRGLKADQLSIEARILVVADIFDALTAKRPYRDGMPVERALEIIRKDAPKALDPDCVTALEQTGIECDHTFVDLQTLEARLRAEIQA